MTIVVLKNEVNTKELKDPTFYFQGYCFSVISWLGLSFVNRAFDPKVKKCTTGSNMEGPPQSAGITVDEERAHVGHS